MGDRTPQRKTWGTGQVTWIATALVLLVAASALFQIESLAGKFNRALRDVEQVGHLNDAQGALWELRFGLPNYVIKNVSTRSEIRSRSAPLIATVRKEMQAVLETADPDVRSSELQGLIARWRSGFDRYAEVRPKFLDAVDAGRMKEAYKIRERQTNPAARDAVAAIGKLIDSKRDRAQKRWLSAKQGIRLAEWVVLFSSCLAAALIWLIAKRYAASRYGAAAAELEAQVARRSNDAKSIFLANMSHEIRTPLHGILSFARLGQMKMETAPKEKIKSYFDEISESGSRLLLLVNDVLDLTKLETGKTTYTLKTEDLGEISDTVASELSAFASEKGISLQVRKGGPRLQAGFDGSKIMQVLRNLVSNAIKFSDRGTVVTIDLERNGRSLRCRVCNRGVGIPAAELEEIFDKFVQSSKTRTAAGGTGLGLAICREIVRHHGGRIWAESDPDGDTRFIFELPIAEPSALPMAG